MEPFDDVGTFWLPSTPDHAVSGRITFDGEGFALELDESIVEFVMPEGQVVHVTAEWVAHPVVHGRLREQGDVTLLEVSGVPLAGPFRGTESWSASAALLGPHVTDPTFTQASIAFDVLVAWAKPPSLTSADEPLAPTLDLGREVLATASVDDAAVELVSTWSGEVGDINVSAQRQCWLRVEFPEASLSDLLDNWVRPLQDMLIVLLGRPVRLTKLALRRSDATENASVRVVFGAIRAGAEVNLAPLSLISWERETMFTREELPVAFSDLIKGWFAARTRLSEAVTLLCSPFYAPFMYSEHRYAATFQSAESIARAMYTGAEKAKDEHAARVLSIVEAARAADVKAEDIEWAERVLRSRNDKTLTNLIEELLADAGSLGEAILARDPNFASTAASARTRVSHPGGERGLTTVQRYWYGQVLLWVVRARLAIEAGIPADDVFKRIIKRGNFTQSVDRLDRD